MGAGRMPIAMKTKSNSKFLSPVRSNAALLNRFYEAALHDLHASLSQGFESKTAHLFRCAGHKLLSRNQHDLSFAAVPVEKPPQIRAYLDPGRTAPYYDIFPGPARLYGVQDCVLGPQKIDYGLDRDNVIPL